MSFVRLVAFEKGFRAGLILATLWVSDGCGFFGGGRKRDGGDDHLGVMLVFPWVEGTSPRMPHLSRRT